MKKQFNWLAHLFILVFCCIWYTFFPFSTHWLIGSILLVSLLVMQWLLAKKTAFSLKQLEDKLAQHENSFKKLGYELNVASSQVSSVSENLYVTLEENNAFTQQLFAQTEEMTHLNTSVT
ncbi:MAG: hypothetical protein K0S30_1892, partial [Clostridia bacterium]|nr:hypothetical protein [Clostridia bacterium]